VQHTWPTIARDSQELCVALSDNEFCVMRAKRYYDEDAEIQTDVNETAFCRHGYREEDLPKIFDAETILGWKAEDAKREQDYQKQSELRDRQRFEELKRKFEPTKAV
jgi:hypothetical protein